MVEKKVLIRDPFPNWGIEKFRLLWDSQKEEMFAVMKWVGWKYLPEEYKQECRKFDEAKRQEKQRKERLQREQQEKQEAQALEEQKAREALIQEEKRKQQQKQEEQERVDRLARVKLDKEKADREREESERRNRLQEQERTKSILAYQKQERERQRLVKRNEIISLLANWICSFISVLFRLCVWALPIAIPISIVGGICYAIYYRTWVFVDWIKFLLR